MKVDIYIASENGQPKNEDRWMGYIIRAEKFGDHGERTGTRLIEATSYRAALTMMVCVLDRFTRPAEITFHLENEWIAGRLTRHEKDGEYISDLEMWQQNGWQTARGTPVKNKDEWQRLYNKLRVFEHAGAKFQFLKLEKDDKNRERILRAIETAMEYAV